MVLHFHFGAPGVSFIVGTPGVTNIANFCLYKILDSKVFVLEHAVMEMVHLLLSIIWDKLMMHVSCTVRDLWNFLLIS